MNKTILTLLSILFINSYSYSQTIPLDSFYRDGATWTNVVYSSSMPCSHCASFTYDGYRIIVSGDTLIAGVSYRKLYGKGVGGYANGKDFANNEYQTWDRTETTDQYFGRLRISGRQVYFTADTIPNFAHVWTSFYTLGKEYLLYDFGLHVGSAFSDSVYTFGDTLRSIDSIMLPSGVYCKRYNLDKNTWIEGMGVSGTLLYMSLLWFTGPPSHADYPLCYNNLNLSDTFPIPNIMRSEPQKSLAINCFDVHTANVTTINTSNRELSIYPNPLPDNELHVASGNNDKIETIQLYDIVGREQFKINRPFTSPSDNTITIPALQKGMYLVKILFSDNSMFTKPMMKN